MSIQFNGLSTEHNTAFQDSYPTFVEPRHDAKDSSVLNCQVYRLEKPVAVPIEQLTQDGQYAPIIKRQTNSIQITGYNFEAEFELSYTAPKATLGVYNKHELSLQGVIENFLRVFSAYSVVQHHGVMLHSAGFANNNSAYVLCGRSGVGKTTLTRKAHAAGYNVLSDDINLLLPESSGKYKAQKVPFAGEFGRTLDQGTDLISYPVRCIALLEQGSHLAVLPVSKASSVARLLTACPFTNGDNEEMHALFDVLSQLVKQVPVLRLQTRRDDKIEAIIDLINSEI